MPGIHVRTFSKFGWIEREKEPTLTVPGSYWLCCKQNIYKFTFKHHKTMRATQDFTYDRELMKVVRKIIKLHPRQGQQFCTRHLLVTYNHSSWTRQDKMFALLKFRDRPDATAYPHAFILTIKISPSNSSESLDRCQKKPGPLSRLPSTPIDETSTDSSTRLTPIIRPPPPAKRPPSPLKTPETPKRLKSASFLGDISLPLVEKYLHQQQDPLDISPTDEEPQEPINDIQETIDMPYQYLIEREIEKTKAKIAKSMKINSSLEKSSKKQNEHQPQNNEITSSWSKITSNTSSPNDNSSAKSADITDLVMEGLMFTISQDKDTVTVVEQKTKLEPDEVLVNSEKVEGKAGEECLVNSSLLKLENLITKIEMAGAGERERLPFVLNPLDSPKKMETNFIESQEKVVISNCLQKNLIKNTKINGLLGSCKFKKSDNSFNTSRIPSPSSSASTSTGENDSEGDERIEEEDIIPEALQNNINNNLRGRLTSPLMDDEYLSSPEGNRSKARIVSSEIVKYDLSHLRSAKPRRLDYGETMRIGNGEEMVNGVLGESSDSGDGDGERRKRLAGKRRILPDEEHQENVRINLLKFVSDMTMGVRVVIQRLDIRDLSNFGGKRGYSHECV